MANRKRKFSFLVHVNEAEDKLIRERMIEAGVRNRQAFARKMMIDGYIIKTDFSSIKQLSFEINKVGNNINQIARGVNETGELSRFQLDELKRLMKEIAQYQIKTLKEFNKIFRE